MGLAAVVAAWMACAVREGLVRSRDESGGQTVRLAVLGSLGRLLGQSGNILAAVLLAEPAPPGLRGLFIAAFVFSNPAMVTGLLVLCALVILPLYLADDLLMTSAVRMPQATARPSRSWLLIGGLLLLLVTTVSFSSFGDPIRINLQARLLPAGPGHPLGTDSDGRDFLDRLAAGTRISLGVAVGAACIAGVGGLALTVPLLLVAAAGPVTQPSPILLAALVGSAGVPVVACPVRRLDRFLRSGGAWGMVVGWRWWRHRRCLWRWSCPTCSWDCRNPLHLWGNERWCDRAFSAGESLHGNGGERGGGVVPLSQDGPRAAWVQHGVFLTTSRW